MTDEAPPIGLHPQFVAAFNLMCVEMHDISRSKGWYDDPKTYAAVDAVQQLHGIQLDDAGRQALFDVLLPYTQRTPGDFIALMHSELSEALEGERKPGPDKHLPMFDQVSVELADVIIRIMDYARHKKLHVAEALIAKAEFNRSRPHRHGNKTL